MAAKPEKAKKQAKEQVYLVPITWIVTGYYAIRASNVETAVEKAEGLPFPNDIKPLCEIDDDKVVPIPREFSHLKVHE